MAKIYAAPFKPPPFDFSEFDRAKYDEYNKNYEAKLIARCLANATGHKDDDLLGQIVDYQVADGYASYMVWSIKPFVLIHIDIGDGYRADPLIEKGMTAKYVRDRIERATKLQSLFTKKGFK